MCNPNVQEDYAADSDVIETLNPTVPFSLILPKSEAMVNISDINIICSSQQYLNSQFTMKSTTTKQAFYTQCLG